MGRSAELKGFEQVAELGLCRFSAHPDGRKHALLNVPAMNSYASAAYLVAVGNHIVGLGAYLFGGGLEHVQVVIHGCSKGVMHRRVALLLVIPLQQRKVCDPGKGQHVVINQ